MSNMRNEPQLTKTLSAAHKALGRFSWRHFRLPSVNRDLASLRELRVSHTRSYHYGGDLSAVQGWVVRSLQEHGNHAEDCSTKTASLVIHRLAQESAAVRGWSDVFIILRTFLPGHGSGPRWHQDGSFLGATVGQFKVISTLRGPTTWFAEEPKDDAFQSAREALNHIKQETPQVEVEEIQSRFNSFFTPPSPPELRSAETQPFATIFRVSASNWKATYHSEPVNNDHRVVIAIVPGDLFSIFALKNRFSSANTPIFTTY